MSLLFLCSSSVTKPFNANELKTSLTKVQSRISLVKQKSQRRVQDLTLDLLEKTRLTIHNNNDAEARIIAGSLIQEQNISDILLLLSEICNALIVNGGRGGTTSTVLSESTRKQKECPPELAPSIVTLIYCSTMMADRIPELLFFRRTCQRHFGKAFIRRAMSEQNETIHPRILAKLTSTPSPRLINEYLCVFREQKQVQRNTRLPSLHNDKMSNKITQKFNGNNQEHSQIWGTNHGIAVPSSSSPTNKPPQRISTMNDTGHNVQDKENIKEGTNNRPLSMLSPILPLYTFRPNSHLEIVFDVRTKNPLYVMEKLHVDGVNKNSRKQRHVTKSTSKETKRTRMPFQEEESLPQEYRSRLSHFLHSGYDRGHMAPAADFLDSPSRLRDTFNLCNTSPQVHSMNQSIWLTLENACRRVCNQHGEEIFVVTGPLWLPKEVAVSCPNTTKHHDVIQYPVLGVNSNKGSDFDTFVHVPTHFFKVIVVVKDNTIVRRYACFMVPNAETLPSLSLNDYTITWKELEILSGLQFFPSLSRDGSDKTIVLSL